MSTVFTGESKIFQLAAINESFPVTEIPLVPANVPVVGALLYGSINLGKKLVREKNPVTVATVLNSVYDEVDLLTNNFLEYVDQKNMPWDQAYATWLAYHHSIQVTAQREVIRRGYEL